MSAICRDDLRGGREVRARVGRGEPQPVDDPPFDPDPPAAPLAIRAPKAAPKPSGREAREAQPSLPFAADNGFKLPELAMLAKPKPRSAAFDEGALR